MVFPKYTMWTTTFIAFLLFSPKFQSKFYQCAIKSYLFISTAHYNRLRAQRRRQSSNLLVEQILSLGPDTGSAAVLQLEEAGQKGLAKLLGALTGKQRGKVVNADHAQRGALGVGGQLDGHGGLIEGGGDVVDGDRVVRVGAA